MSREDIVAIALRLFAIFLVLFALGLGVDVVRAAAMQGMSPRANGLSVAIALMPLAVAVVLWYFPLTVARKLLPAMSDSGPALAVSGRDAQEIGFSIVGLWVIATALGDAIYWIMFGLLSMGFDEGQFEIPPGDKASIVATLAELVIGCALLVGSKGLVGLVYRLRYSGPQHPRP